MELYTATATVYDVPEAEAAPKEPAETISIWQLPKILWAAVILFVLNTAIFMGVASIPELNVDIYGEDARPTSVNYPKPSPRVAPEPRRPKAVRMPVKLQPVVLPGPAEGAEMNLPRVTPTADTVR